MQENLTARAILGQLRWPLAIIAIALAGLLGVQAWINHYPPSPLLALAGLPGDRANAGRDCHEPRMLGGRRSRMRRREVMCSGAARNQWRETHHATVGFWSRDVLSAQRQMWFADSATWTAARDSIILALRARSATLRDCPDRSVENQRNHRFLERWSVNGADVGIQGMHNPHSDRQWSLFVVAAPRRPTC